MIKTLLLLRIFEQDPSYGPLRLDSQSSIVQKELYKVGQEQNESK